MFTPVSFRSAFGVRPSASRCCSISARSFWMTGKWSSRKDGLPPGGAVWLHAFCARVYSRSILASVRISGSKAGS